MLEALNIKKNFDKQHVLRGVTASVKRGEVLALIGPSGSGKSTLLRCINHLERIDGGSISVDGDFMVKTVNNKVEYAQPALLRSICLKLGMVFQSYNLFPHLSVLSNLTQAQRVVLNRNKDQAKQIAYELLEKVGLSDKIHEYPCNLSGGQCQRVAIARALAMGPQILCFDEPTSALDPQLTQEVLAVIRNLAGEKHTMIVVTHEMRFAREVADRVVYMREGKIVEEGAANDVLGNARSDELKAFMGD